MTLFQTDDLKVTTIGKRESSALLEVYKQCEDFLALGPVPVASLGMIQKDRADSRRQGGQYCAIRNGQDVLVGVIDFAVTERTNSCFLELLMIAAPWRNKGYGRTVVTCLDQYLKRSYGIQRMNAAVQTNNPKGIRFWKRLGYDVSNEPRDQPDGTVTYEMTKML